MAITPMVELEPQANGQTQGKTLYKAKSSSKLDQLKALHKCERECKKADVSHINKIINDTFSQLIVTSNVRRPIPPLVITDN